MKIDLRKGDRHKPRQGDRHKPRYEKVRILAKRGMRKLRGTRDPLSWKLPNIEGIDGETQNGRYVLLASSDREPIYNPKGLSANDFIDYLLDALKGTILCGYVTHYDVTKGLLSGLNDAQRRILIGPNKKKGEGKQWLAYNRFDRPVTIMINYVPHRTLKIWEYRQTDLKEFWKM